MMWLIKIELSEHVGDTEFRDVIKRYLIDSESQFEALKIAIGQIETMVEYNKILLVIRSVSIKPVGNKIVEID